MALSGLILIDLVNAVTKKLDVFLRSKGGLVEEIKVVPFGNANEVMELLRVYNTAIPCGFLSFPDVNNTKADGGASGLVSTPNFTVPFNFAIATTERNDISQQLKTYADAFQLFIKNVMSTRFDGTEFPAEWMFVNIEFNGFSNLKVDDVFVSLIGFEVKIYAATMAC